MPRLSSYSILSEPLSGGGNALLNGLSGAIDVVSSDLARYLLEELIRNDHRNIWIADDNLHPDTLQEFLASGHLTKETHEEESARLVHVARLIHEEGRKVPHFLIVPNLGCNYRCVYCFEKHLQAAADLHGDVPAGSNPQVLTLEQIDTIYSCIARLSAGADRRGGDSIILYGGEPLEAANQDIIFALVNRGRELGFNFSAITNGHDLDVFLPLMARDAIREVQITFDGPESIHDARRRTRSGEPSFQTLRRNINALLELEGVQVNLRVHVDGATVDEFPRLLEFFRAQGWLDRKDVVVYTSTLYTKDAGGRVRDQAEYDRIQTRLLRYAKGYPNVVIGAASANAREMLAAVLVESKPYRLRTNYCGANSAMYIFAPDGHIYACWESVGKECSRIGSYAPPDRMELDEARREAWFSRSAAEIAECVNCPYCLVCAGGCAQYALYNTGSMQRAFCDNFFKAFPYALSRGVSRNTWTPSA